ncbi:YjiH family protein [Anaerotruncus rubiinfantis]|uniref:YjiH family protein n=2 Tax=Anaerotruncus rubiinfantis TaxID=1720200 RepID=UPI0034A16103
MSKENNTKLSGMDPAVYQKQLLRFLFYTFLGCLVFFCPVKQGDSTNIVFGVITDFLKGLLGDFGVYLIIAIIVGNSIAYFICRFCTKKDSKAYQFYSDVSPYQAIGYVLAAVFAIMYIFNCGPEWIIGPDTGGSIVGILKTILWTISLGAALISLLTAFGSMEFIGTLFEPLMRPLYKLPGRSALDAMASFVGTSSVGCYLTSRIYKAKGYTVREAATISTTFSVVSVSFAAVCAQTAGIMNLFYIIYPVTFVITFVMAFIMPRIPPLSRKPDIYIDGTEQPESARKEKMVYEHGIWREALNRAVSKASETPSFWKEMSQSLSQGVILCVKALGIVFAVGTIGMILAEYTPVFTWLGYPMVPLLNLFGVPDASVIAPATLIGVAEMFLPNLLIAEMEISLAARFFIHVLSLVQIIYFSEVGAVMIISGLPVKVWEMVVIFLERTLIAIPLIAGVMHLLVMAGVLV